MKSNELRIGNKVFVDGKIITVESVGETGINIEACGGYYAGEASMEYGATFEKWGYFSKQILIEPIPLTADILDKVDWNGYIKFNIGSYFKIDDVGHLYYRSDYTGINIDYLHQLQNLYFALTGKELEVSL